MSKGKLPGNILDFKQFLLRKQVLALYRESLRIVREEKSLDNQKQLKDWIRYEFESRKGLTDPDVIKMHLSKGRMSLKEIAAAVRMAK